MLILTVALKKIMPCFNFMILAKHFCKHFLKNIMKNPLQRLGTGIVIPIFQFSMHFRYP